MPSYVSKGKLNIDGAFFTCDTIENIPEAVVKELKNEKKDETNLVFFGPQSEFSNMHPIQFSVDNVTYYSSEQYIQSKKANLFNDDATEQKIMLTNSPYEAKKLGNKVANYNEQTWKENAEQIALKGVFEKFRQNLKLSLRLVNTNQKLFEGSPDTFWGTGVHVKSTSCLDTSRWYSEGLMH